MTSKISLEIALVCRQFSKGVTLREQEKRQT